jgi:hypothetical protein
MKKKHARKDETDSPSTQEHGGHQLAFSLSRSIAHRRHRVRRPPARQIGVCARIPLSTRAESDGSSRRRSGSRCGSTRRGGGAVDRPGRAPAVRAAAAGSRHRPFHSGGRARAASPPRTATGNPCVRAPGHGCPFRHVGLANHATDVPHVRPARCYVTMNFGSPTVWKRTFFLSRGRGASHW